ncbi:hypothetical protein DL95DRAFT_408730 [Leptodontidium sp. 2 PMI_412]|nr:hypothetical protein DL95DRAFT_408730 [Leptodontidium sp. 2 PMI_412]
MPPPPAKKQKTSSGGSPIIFTTARHKPDIRMFVFDQEFHVYSGMLKMNSAFFETMLEPSGGIQPTSTSPLFKSDWYTTLDKDLGWVLSFDLKCKHKDLSTFQGSVSREQQAFVNLLSAIFSKEYHLADANELESMTKLADYRALPIVSYSLSGTIYNSHGFINSIASDPCTLLVSAYKLRHKLLFREAFIIALGPWTKPSYRKLKSSYPELFNLADAVYQMVDSKISMVTRELFRIAASRFHYSRKEGKLSLQLVQNVAAESYHCVEMKGKMLWPMFVRNSKISVDGFNGDGFYHNLSIQKVLGELLQNESVFNKNATAGASDFEDRFLCFSIPDEELPWDTTQIDY